jgi:hypothetical protein
MAIRRTFMETGKNNIFFIMATSPILAPNRFHIHWVPRISFFSDNVTKPSYWLSEDGIFCIETYVGHYSSLIEFHNIFNSNLHKTGWCNGNAIELYSVGYYVERRPRHQLYWLWLLWSFSLLPENASFQILSKSVVTNHSLVGVGWSEIRTASWNKQYENRKH